MVRRGLVSPVPSVALLTIALLIAAGAWLAGAAQQKPAAPVAPGAPVAAPAVQNLIVVTIDTVRSDHLGCYGYFRDTTPALDQLAAESLRFDHCRTPIAQTTPSHTSIFTGAGPYEHGVNSNHAAARPARRGEGRKRGQDGRAGHDADDDEESGRLVTSPTLRTLAEVMHARGVLTGGFVGATPVKKSTGLGAGFDEWTEPERSRRPGAEVIRDALAFVTSCKQSPFFVWVHLFDAHEPYTAVPDEYAKRYTTDEKLKAWLAARGFPEKTDELDDRGLTVAGVNNEYDGALRWLDDQVAVLLARLREPDLKDRTALVVVADHGTSNGQHSHMGHGVCWDEQFRVPLFVRVPGVAPAVCDEPMSTLDLWPTLFALAPGLRDDGFLAQCRGRDVLAKGFEPGPVFGTAARRPVIDAVTFGRWKLLRDASGGAQLFDLQADPNELADVAATQPKIVARLSQFLDGEVAFEKRWRAVHAGEAQPPTDEDLAEYAKRRKELEELGYPDGH